MTYYKIIGLLSLIALCLICTHAQATEYYQYRDSDGVLHYTDTLSHVPVAQRKNLTRFKKIETTIAPTLPQVTEEKKTDTPKDQAEFSTDHNKQLQSLNQEKEDLEKIRISLIKKIQLLEEKKAKVKTPEESVLYETQVSQLNNEIESYEARRAEFDTKRQEFEKKEE